MCARNIFQKLEFPLRHVLKSAICVLRKGNDALGDTANAT